MNMAGSPQMRDRIRTSVIVPMIWLCLLGTLAAQDRFDRFWRPFAETGLRMGDVAEAGQGNLFMPVYQSEVSMLFADLRGNWTDRQAAHGNFGLAFRQMMIHDWIFGIHGAYDIRHSEFGNNFHQAVLGLEMLRENMGLRWNGYLAGEGPKALPELNGVTVIGNQLFIQEAAERAYSGQDLEFEGLLWRHEAIADQSWRAWHFFDWELWGSAGIYNFDNDAAGFESMTGPRLRLELRMFDVPIAGPDSRVVIAGQYEDDDVRGDVKSISMLVRIPFGRGTRQNRTLLSGLNRRMVAPIQRNTEIISVTGFGQAERAAFAQSGQAISQVVAVDALTADVQNELNSAGANSLVIVDGTEGTISPGATLTTQMGQMLLGGGSRLEVVGLNSGAVATFTAPGERPLIDSMGNTAFSLVDSSQLIGLDIANSGAVAAVDFGVADGVFLEDVAITTTGNDAHGILANGATGFSIMNSTIATNGATANGLEIIGDSDGSATALAINTTGLNSNGVRVGDTSFLNLQQSSIFTSEAGSEGILANDSAQLSAGGNTITAVGTNTIGILADPGAGGAMAVFLSNNAINASSTGIALGGANFTAGTLDANVLTNVVIVDPGENEIDVETNGTAVANVSISGNVTDPLTGTIRLADLGGGINVLQAAPGDAGGINAANSLAPTNVLVPGTAPDFSSPVQIESPSVDP